MPPIHTNRLAACGGGGIYPRFEERQHLLFLNLLVSAPALNVAQVRYTLLSDPHIAIKLRAEAGVESPTCPGVMKIVHMIWYLHFPVMRFLKLLR